jgi:hypothetical protein
MQLTTRALFSLIPAALVAPANYSAPIAPRADGYTITMRVSPATEAPITITFKTAGERMRLEADLSSLMGGRGGSMMTGAFLLPRDDGKLIAVLPNMTNPMAGGTGFAMTMDLAGMAARVGAPPPKVTDAPIEDLGAGETMLGYKTHKYRVRQPDNTVEFWVAELPGTDFKKFATNFGARFSGIDPRMAEKIPAGFAMKAVVSGKDPVTMEVTKVDKTSFSDADFEVPAGIQVMDMSGIMGGRGRGRGN